MALTQIIYTSQPFGFDDSTLSNILLDARQANIRDGITGALVCRRDIYLQMLEGEDEVVHAALDRIARDDRHANLELRHDAPAAERLFGDWAMLHDPAHTWAWSEAEIAGGALDAAAPLDFMRIFTGIARRQAAA